MAAARAPYFEVRASPIQGQGVFARRRIRKGTRIVEYTGEHITPEEADRRYDDDAMARPHTFLFTLSRRTIVDGAAGGNEARLINHSCDPNCEAVIEGGHIFIEALRTIQPGDELTYDYQLERPGPYRAEWRQRYACRCGAANCRGTMLLPKKRRKTKDGGRRVEG